MKTQPHIEILQFYLMALRITKTQWSFGQSVSAIGLSNAFMKPDVENQINLLHI